MNKGVSACTTTNKCKLCEGDCDNDSHCESTLKCYQRTSATDVVPGCAASGYSGVWDYCYDPNAGKILLIFLLWKICHRKCVPNS